MDYFPAFLKLKDKDVLVVGGGAVALRKTRAFLSCSARLTVVAPVIVDGLRDLADGNQIRWLPEPFHARHIEGAHVVVAATDDVCINDEVSRRCDERQIPVNVVDDPERSSFIVPAVVDRSPLVIGISSGGAAPVLTRLWRARLEVMLPAGYGRLAALAQSFRAQVKARISGSSARLRFWESVLDGPVAEHMLAGREDEASRLLQVMLEQGSEKRNHLTGEVYLVGAGPGDPDLLTFRALRLMQKADVVLYDRLVSPGILDLVRKDAERIYVGKARKNHALPQSDINSLLVEHAREGKRVLRLKGGDPFIFGRGGEEIESLMQFGIPFQVVPGITAASGCAAYAGIPLTHRDHAHSCSFVTGHPKDGGVDLDWATLTQPNHTVVIYMGLQGLEKICQQLIDRGLSPEHPAALIQQGTTPAQRVIISDLARLAERANEQPLVPPTLVIVGEVVRLHEKLAWFRADPTLRNAFAPTGQ